MTHDLDALEALARAASESLVNDCPEHSGDRFIADSRCAACGPATTRFHAKTAACVALAAQGAAVLALIARVREAERQLREGPPCGSRVCDQPVCDAPVVKHEIGNRRCAAGHPLRWIAIDSQADVLARAETAERERDAAIAERDRLREALADYGEHGRDCDVTYWARHGGKGSRPPCDCGLDDAIGGGESDAAHVEIADLRAKLAAANRDIESAWASIRAMTTPEQREQLGLDREVPGSHERDLAQVVTRVCDALGERETEIRLRDALDARRKAGT